MQSPFQCLIQFEGGSVSTTRQLSVVETQQPALSGAVGAASRREGSRSEAEGTR